jgi:CubicO group peptidase (beta-lactamase class C family)
MDSCLDSRFFIDVCLYPTFDYPAKPHYRVESPSSLLSACVRHVPKDSVQHVFESSIASAEETGASLCVYHGDECIIDLAGGLADVEKGTPWTRNTRIVVFSVSKGLSAMALHLLVERGLLHWDAPVTDYWPEFGQVGKGGITVRTLINHEAGLAALDQKLTLAQCAAREPGMDDGVHQAMVEQKPNWEPGTNQGYHAVTWGMYVQELFWRITGEDIGAYLHRELLDPLNSDARLGTAVEFDADMATLYPPSTSERLVNMLGAGFLKGRTNEGRMARDLIRPSSIARRAFLNPSPARKDVREYNEVHVRRAALPWASATSTARGIARAYIPFANGGVADRHRYFSAESLEPIYKRQGWRENDLTLQKPIGWSQGWVKEEIGVFAANTESFGHPGLGGALGWCDPVNNITIGYVMNKMDWRVRSPRALALCKAIYESEDVQDRIRSGR